MKENIYTIPVNEAFSVSGGCPICRMKNALETSECERITGAAMMEPDVRTETNKSGFCKKHFDSICESGKALPVSLILESHLDYIDRCFDYVPPKRKYNEMASKLHIQNNDCYVCSRIKRFLSFEMDALFTMLSDADFQKKFDEAEYFCLPHLETLVSYAPARMGKKDSETFIKKLLDKERAYFSKLKTDVSDFAKTFDHRFSDEDFPNAKGSIERSIKAIIGE